MKIFSFFKTPVFFCCLCSTAFSQVFVGDQILIDYGNVRSSILNSNSVIGVDTGNNFTLNLENLVVLNSGVETGANVSVSPIDGFVNNNLIGNGTITNSTIFRDGIFDAATFTVTISGLDSDFTYDVFTGFSRRGNNTGNNVEVNGDDSLSFPDGGNANFLNQAFGTFSDVILENVQLDNTGEINITVDDIAGPDVAHIAYTLLTFNGATSQEAVDSNAARINNAVANGDIDGTNLSLDELENELEIILNPIIATGVISSFSLPDQLPDDGSGLTVDTTTPVAGITITDPGTTNFNLVDNNLNLIALDFDLSILNNQQLTTLNSAGLLGVANGEFIIEHEFEDLTLQTNTILSDNVLQTAANNFVLVANTFDLALNGSHHRTAFERLEDEDIIEWGTYDFQDDTDIDLVQQYLEAGLATKLGLGDIAAAISIGFSEFEQQTTDVLGESEIENRSILLNLEFDKTYFDDKLVLSALATGAYHQQRLNRDVLIPVVTTTASLAPIIADVETSIIDGVTSSAASNGIPGVIVGGNLSINNNVTAFVEEDFITNNNTISGAIRFRGDYQLYENEYIAIRPRFSYLYSISSVGEYTEERPNLIQGNRFDISNITRTQTTVGLDFDWFINDKYDLRLLGELVSTTTGEIDITATQLDTNISATSSVDESSVSYQRVGAELGIKFIDDSELQIFVGRLLGDVSRNQFSLSLQNIF